jgi:hypothetical protein
MHVAHAMGPVPKVEIFFFFLNEVAEPMCFGNSYLMYRIYASMIWVSTHKIDKISSSGLMVLAPIVV